MSGCVYTCVFGDIADRLRPPPKQQTPVEFVAFVDGPAAQLPVHGWELRPPVHRLPNMRRQARWHKCMAHELFPDAEWTLWIDGSLEVCTDDIVDQMESLLEDKDLYVFEHCQRTSVRSELLACHALKKDDIQVMEAQVSRYLKAGFPDNCGLAETTAVLRLNTLSIAYFNRHWWHEIEKGSVRDQLSFNYVSWRRCIPTHGTFEGNQRENPYFLFHPHWKRPPRHKKP